MPELKEMKKLVGTVKWKLIAAITVVVVLVVGVLCVQNTLYKNKIQKLNEDVERLSEQTAKYEIATAEVVLDVVNSEVRSIGELATIEYFYTDAGKYSNPKELFGVEVPFTTKSFIAKWNGTIKAGIKVDQIRAEVDENNHIVTVYLPQAEILSHEIDADSFETLDEKDNLFNPIHIDDIRSFDKESKTAMEERAIEMGILEKAQESAEAILEGLLNANPEISNGYTLNFAQA